jgi:uncharacterized protein YjbJ (UPF0337 family)
MNRDERKGWTENLEGRLKEATGVVAGKPELEEEGARERAEGEARQKLGEARRDVGEAVEELGKKIGR